MKYIDADKLKERVTRLIASARQNDWPIAEDYLRRVIDIIDSLQQEQPEVDLEKEIIRYQREDMDRDTTVADVAHHFYKLGKKSKKGGIIMLYLEDFYVGEVESRGYSSRKFMKFVCKQTDIDIPVFVECVIRNENKRQFSWAWNTPWHPIPDNRIYDTGIANDFKHTKILESFYAFNFSDSAFGGYESYVSKEYAPDKNGVYGIIPKGSYYWLCGKHYISDRLILNFNEKKMTLEEAIKHCQEKACGNTLCNLEHKQLAEWLIELKHYREISARKEK